MLSLARQHALDRVQFGRPVASFQAIRHRLAETLVAIEGAEATLQSTDDDLSSLLAKAAAGQAALTTARHCQQVLGGIGFTAEHELHRHVRRALVLDGLLGSTRELTREAGAELRAEDQRRGSWTSESPSSDALNQSTKMRRTGQPRWCTSSRRRGQLRLQLDGIINGGKPSS